jgi:hypothetical protein
VLSNDACMHSIPIARILSPSFKSDDGIVILWDDSVMEGRSQVGHGPQPRHRSDFELNEH